MITIGKPVPDLRGESTAGPIRLRDLKGQYVVVYFYPKDNTPGCTREAQDFRDLAKRFAKHKVVVLGVSRDSLASHEKFRDKQSLKFALVSDPDETWCKAFDVIHEKTLYGRKFLGVVRSTFLIGPDGKLRREWRNVKVPGHAEAVLATVEAESARQ
jgi:peroxiredoxin Q/BCP